jgi:hypothetical protein
VSLDLDSLTNGWDIPPGENAARVISDDSGRELLQMRVDLGVLQMHLDGRPEGERYGGLQSTLDYIQHELRVGRDEIEIDHWMALDREITQRNYRRIGLTAVAETALSEGDEAAARGYLIRVLRDIEFEQEAIDLMVQQRGSAGQHTPLLPSLAFNQGRLTCQLHLIEEDVDAAIESALTAADDLQAMLDEVLDIGDVVTEPEEDENIGVAYLHELARQLRTQYGVSQTLREQLDEAVESEDYELAGRLHDQLRARERERALREAEMPWEDLPGTSPR